MDVVDEKELKTRSGGALLAMIKMTNGQCIWISNGPMSICNKYVMISNFFPNKNKVYSSRSLPEPAHSTSFLKMAIICRSGRGCKVALLCMHRSNRSFPCPTFFGNQCTSIQLSQPLIGFILPFAIWCSSSSFSVFFAFSTIMNVCCRFHDETLFITTLQ